MRILIKSAKIIDPSSPFNGTSKHILIENGIIKQISDSIDTAIKADHVFDEKNLCISPGWFDFRSNFKDPGFEYKEDLDSGCKAAMAGGFTAVAISPSTNPPIHSKSEVEYIKYKTAGQLVDVFPIGTISHNRDGKELSEMYDMHLSGAVAFTDDKRPLSHAGLMLRALLYAKNFDGLIINYPEEKTISEKGQMNEGINSTMLGMKGIPAIAEEIMIQRDLQLCEYTDARIHFSNISTAGAVDLIRKAKARKLKVSADVNAHQLIVTDESLKGFDSNFKVKPPFRSSEDIKALIAGLKDGTIDVICSDHTPEDTESKNLEFEHAAFGIIGLESAFSVINTVLKDKGFSLEDIICKISINPRKLLKLEVPTIQEGQKANITLFDPSVSYEFDNSHIRSKSKNTPFIGQQFTGKAIAVINNGQIRVS